MASALAVWGVARAFGGRVLLRAEDHDRTRSRPEFERAILEELEWLGFRPDEPFSRQSDRQEKYDLDQGVDLVIRGEDLLASTGRQIQLAQLLGRQSAPVFLHHPLITHPGGQKLSKSNQDTGLRELRAAGWSVERVLGHAGLALGLTQGEPITQTEIVTLIAALPQ